MDKKLTITFTPLSGQEDVPEGKQNISVSIESSDPNDDMNDIVSMLHSTLQALAENIEED